MHLIDSDRVVDYLNGRQNDIRFLDALEGPRYLSLITYGEVYEGIYGGRNPQLAEAGFDALLRTTTVLPLTTHIMKLFARLRADNRRAGLRIGDMDLLIAATALHHNLTLVTRNRRDFEKVPGLRML